MERTWKKDAHRKKLKGPALGRIVVLVEDSRRREICSVG